MVNNLYLMRHGFSCANTFQLQSIWKQIIEWIKVKKMDKIYHPSELMEKAYEWFDGRYNVDSYLTELGMIQAYLAGKSTDFNIKHYYTSSMFRAIQTCYFFLLGRFANNNLKEEKITINITPFLRESGTRTSNNLHSEKEIEKFCNDLKNTIYVENLINSCNEFAKNFSLVNIPNIDLKKFISKIDFKIIPSNSYNQSKKEFLKLVEGKNDVLAVSHNHTIKKSYCNNKFGLKNTMIVNFNEKCKIVYNPDLSYNIFKKGKNFDTKKLINFFNNTICNEYSKLDKNTYQLNNIPELNNYITQNMNTEKMNTENKKPTKLKVFIVTQNRNGQVFSNKRVGEGKGHKTMDKNPFNMKTFRVVSNSNSFGKKIGTFLKRKNSSFAKNKNKKELNDEIKKIRNALENRPTNSSEKNDPLHFDIGFIYLSNSKNSMFGSNDQLLQSIYYDICWRNRDMKDTFNLYRVSNGTDRLGVIVKASLLDKTFKPMSSNTTPCKKYTSLVATEQENNTIKFRHSSNNKNGYFAFDCSSSDITVLLNINGKVVKFDKHTNVKNIKNILDNANNANNNEMNKMLKRMQQQAQNNANNNANNNIGNLTRGLFEEENVEPVVSNVMKKTNEISNGNKRPANSGVNKNQSVKNKTKFFEQKILNQRLANLNKRYINKKRELEKFNENEYINALKKKNNSHLTQNAKKNISNNKNELLKQKRARLKKELVEIIKQIKQIKPGNNRTSISKPMSEYHRSLEKN